MGCFLFQILTTPTIMQASAGYLADGRHVSNRARDEASSFRENYRAPATLQVGCVCVVRAYARTYCTCRSPSDARGPLSSSPIIHLAGGSRVPPGSNIQAGQKSRCRDSGLGTRYLKLEHFARRSTRDRRRRRPGVRVGFPSSALAAAAAASATAAFVDRES